MVVAKSLIVYFFSLFMFTYMFYFQPHSCSCVIVIWWILYLVCFYLTLWCMIICTVADVYHTHICFQYSGMCWLFVAVWTAFPSRHCVITYMGKAPDAVCYDAAGIVALCLTMCSMTCDGVMWSQPQRVFDVHNNNDEVTKRALWSHGGGGATLMLPFRDWLAEVRRGAHTRHLDDVTSFTTSPR